MFYKRHILFCCNQKADGSGCHQFAAEDAFNFAKTHLKSLDLWGEGKLRASKTGCLGRCELGPTCVIYPDGIWYSYVDNEDVAAIINDHLINGKPVSRLKL